MTDEKPTGDAGASISERLESYLAAGEETKAPEADKPGKEAAPDAKPAVEDRAKDAPEEADGPQYELSDVAKVLGLEESILDVDEDGSLKIKTVIDGKEGAAKLQDLLKSYQLQGHVDQKSRRVAEQERAVAERANEYEQFAQTKFQELDVLAHAAQQMLAGDFASVNWDSLIHEDPLDYQAKRHAFERRQGQTQQFLQQLHQQKQQIGQALQWKQQQELQMEAQRLMSLVPEWADPKVRGSEGAEMRQWLESKGVQPRAIDALTDAGLVSVLRSYFKADKNAPAVAAVEKKVRAAPKLVRPGQGTGASERKADSVRGLKQQIRESGGKKGIAEYLIASGKV